MQNFNEEERLIPSYLKKLEKVANPFIGTAMGAMMEKQERLAKALNPLKGSAFENSLEATKQNMLYSQKMNEWESALQKINLLQEANEKYMTLSASRSLMAGLGVPKWRRQTLSDRFSSLSLPGTLIDKNYWQFLHSPSIFEHLNLYEDYEEENAQSVAEPKEQKSRLITLDDTIRIQSLIKSVFDDNQQLFRVDPHDFEAIVAELLRHKGFLVELTKKTRDGGKDIIALHDTNGLGVNRYLIECKRNSLTRPVGVNIIKSFCYTVIREERANKGIIFTSSYFTRDAKQLKEKERNIIDFKDGVEILSWISEYLKIKLI